MTTLAPPSPARALTLSGALVALLVLVAAMPPLGTAAYLPGLPRVAEEFAVSTSAVQLTLTVYIVGMAIGQIAIGPLSDRLGRRRTLLVGIAAFVVLSSGVAFAPALEPMLALRLLQGVAAGAGAVLARAVVADLATGDRAARIMNVITAAGLLVPAVAPLLGSLILGTAGWRVIFLVLAGVGAALGAWVLLALPETHPARRTREIRAATGAPSSGSRRPALRTDGRLFWLFTAAQALSFATMYALIAAGPFVFQEVYGFSPTGYAWTMAAMAGTTAAVGITGSRLMGRRTRFGTLTAPRSASAGFLVALLGAVAVLMAALTQAPVTVLIPAVLLTVAPLALITGSSTALAMGTSPLKHGSASGVVGSVQALLGAATPPLVGILGASVLPLGITLMVGTVLGVAVTQAAARRLHL